MKKKTKIDCLSLLLICSFSSNLILHIVFYINDKQIGDLIFSIVCGVCLIAYVVVLIIAEKMTVKQYCIVYDDYYLVNGINIILESKFVSSKKINKFKKYCIDANLDDIYQYTRENYFIDFAIINIDEYRKLIVVNKCNIDVDDLYSVFAKDKEEMLKHYYANHEIEKFGDDNAIVINKRNIALIKEYNDKYCVLKYRHYVPIEIDLKYFNTYKIGWDYIGGSHDDGIEYFESYEKAEEYISYL